MIDNKTRANKEWSDKIDTILEDLKRQVMTPGFTGHVALEIHGHDGQIKKAVTSEQKHLNLTRAG